MRVSQLLRMTIYIFEVDLFAHVANVSMINSSKRLLKQYYVLYKRPVGKLGCKLLISVIFIFVKVSTLPCFNYRQLAKRIFCLNYQI